MAVAASRANLTTSYLGLKLAHPFMLGACPLSGHLDNVRRLEDAGCAAIVMHSLFEEQIAEVTSGGIPHVNRAVPRLAGPLAHFYIPEKFPLRPDEYLEQIRKIKSAVSIPVVASRPAQERFHAVEQQGLRDWMARHEYESIDAFRGRLSLKHCTNLTYFERVNYLWILQTWPDVVQVQDPGVWTG